MTGSLPRRFQVAVDGRSRRKRRRGVAFTLIEVVVALGIFTFAIVAIAGLFVVGVSTNKDSDQIQAANIASLLISTRRAVPTNSINNFALPPLNATYSSAGTFLTNTGGVALDGTTNGTPAYNLYYQVGTNAATGAHLAQVHLMLWGPPVAPMPTNNLSGRYEVTTQVALP
jgi:type II secretory pathway pseudopilin PulG